MEPELTKQMIQVKILHLRDLNFDSFFCFSYTATHSSSFQSEKYSLVFQKEMVNTATMNIVRLLRTFVVWHQELIFTFSGMLKELGGGLELSENWARNVLKSMNLIKRKCTTGKVEPCKKFLEKGEFTFEKSLSVLYWFMIYRQRLFWILMKHPFCISSRESTLFLERCKNMFSWKV